MDDLQYLIGPAIAQGNEDGVLNLVINGWPSILEYKLTDMTKTAFKF